MRRAVALLALGLVFCAACVADNGADAQGGRTRVVASFFPLAEAAARVGGTRVAVTNLTPAGSEPHDFELAPPDVDHIEDADVVVYLGDGFQPAVEKAVRRTKGRALDVLSSDFDLIQGSGSDDGERVADPHLWLDPTIMKQIVERVRTALVEADPANRAAYEGDAAGYLQELDALDGAFRQGLAQCDRRVIVTAHDAFGYLARHYGLVQDAIAGLEPEAEPDPQQLSDLTAKVQAEGTTTVFTETLVSPRVAESLAREAGVKTAVLNPVEGLSEDEEKSNETYVSVMRANLETLRAALGCR